MSHNDVTGARAWMIVQSLVLIGSVIFNIFLWAETRGMEKRIRYAEYNDIALETLAEFDERADALGVLARERLTDELISTYVEGRLAESFSLVAPVGSQGQDAVEEIILDWYNRLVQLLAETGSRLHSYSSLVDRPLIAKGLMELSFHRLEWPHDLILQRVENEIANLETTTLTAEETFTLSSEDLV